MFFVPVLVAATLVTGTGSTPAVSQTPVSQASGQIRWGHYAPRYISSLDAASSAIPSTANPTVGDNAVATARTSSSAAKAVASSVATSNCDGCSGTSTTFQVVYFTGTAATGDNTAAAWSSCTGCTSSAVSVQLVVARRAQPLTVNNRALALNSGCVDCNTSAAAIQFVIAGGSYRELSSQAKALISEIQAELADRLQQPAKNSQRRMAAPEAKALVDDTAARLSKIIVSAVGGAAVQRNVDVQVGQ
ncbi:hypothetical protein [Specibacter cremeus]|uniref:hypothetical protein n=1 Tax=Specibacter cremeus TaxID=1629051 RepID=UPI000F78E006|nr:hypothetical protein [Specibacter cremeus]